MYFIAGFILGFIVCGYFTGSVLNDIRQDYNEYKINESKKQEEFFEQILTALKQANITNGDIIQILKLRAAQAEDINSLIIDLHARQSQCLRKDNRELKEYSNSLREGTDDD